MHIDLSKSSHSLVLVSIIASVILFAGLLFYRYIFPKKKIHPLALIFLFSLLPVISIFRPGVYESGDFSINIYKSMSFYQSLSERNILPRWAGELNATYGYPLFLFTYPLPYYTISFFHFLGFSFITSLKLFLASSFILSGITMYIWIKDQLGKVSGFVAAIFYLFTPYHLVDTHFRISIGEILSFVILPLTLFATTKLLKLKTARWFFLTAFSFALLLLCNPAISLISFLFIALYIIVTWLQEKDKNTLALKISLSALIAGLLLSAFYWLPVNEELRYTHEAQYVNNIEFVQFQELLYSPWRFGFLFQGHHGELSFVIGYVQIAIIIFSFIFLLKRSFNSSQKRKTFFYLITLSLAIFLMLPLSKSLWDTVSILHNFQFTYRILLFVSLFTSVLAGIIAQKLSNKMIIILCAFAIIQTILNWGNRGTIPKINDTILQNNLPYSTSEGEGFQPATPIWTRSNNPLESIIPKTHLEVLSGESSFYQIERTTTKHEYVIDVASMSHFKENTWYFPGWTVFANNKRVSLNYQNPKYPGTITFTLTKGLYKVDVLFLDTPIRTASGTISLITLIGMFLFVFSPLIRSSTRVEKKGT